MTSQTSVLYSLTVFCKRLKTFLFRDASSAVQTRAQEPLYLGTLWRYVNKLLTFSFYLNYDELV